MRRILGIAAMIAPLAACASDASVRAPVTTTPPAFESPQPPAVSDEHAIDRWWDLYGDAQLTALVDQALANSHTAEDAAAKLEQAYFNRRALYAGLLPSGGLTGGASYGGTEQISGGSSFIDPDTGLPVASSGSAAATTLTAGFNVSWELDIFGRSRQGRRVGDNDFRAAVFNYEATRTALAANVAQSLFDARGLAIQLAQAEETVRINSELQRIVRIRVERGLSAGSELDQTIANTRTVEAQAENLRAQLAVANRNLLLLIGRGSDPIASLPVAAEVGSPPPVPAILPARLMQRRPDVRRAEFALQAELARLQVRKLALFPKINLQPGVTITDTIGGDFSGADAIWSLGAGLTVPILERPRLLAEIGAERAVAEQFVIAYERAVQTAYVESENALVQLDSDRRRVNILRDATTHAEAAYRKNNIAYQRGFVDLQTVLIAEQTWRNLRAQLAQAESTLMDRSVQLFKSLGGGWNPEAPAASAPPEIAKRGQS
ncbi:MAG: efflux transporter outer membrane subunit [Caulobacteraceae bacterium]